MKGSTMLATLQRLGVVPSFSRPSVSDDNPFAEALFRTLKYRPGVPAQALRSRSRHARAWVAGFVAWYNTEHLHSGIRFVTPDDRHAGRECRDPRAPPQASTSAPRRRRPERWTRDSATGTPVGDVDTQPDPPKRSRGQDVP